MDRALRTGKVDNYGRPSPPPPLPPPPADAFDANSPRARQASGGEVSQLTSQSTSSADNSESHGRERPADLPSTVNSFTSGSITSTSHTNNSGTAIDSAILDASQAGQATSDDDDRRHADFVLACLKRKGLDVAAADVAEWMARSNGEARAASPRADNDDDAVVVAAAAADAASSSMSGTDNTCTSRPSTSEMPVDRRKRDADDDDNDDDYDADDKEEAAKSNDNVVPEVVAMEEQARKEAQKSAAAAANDEEERWRKESKKADAARASGGVRGEDEDEEDSAAVVENAAGSRRASDIVAASAAGAAAAAAATTTTTTQCVEPLRQDAADEAIMRRFFTKLGQMIGGVSAAAASTRTSTRQQQPPRRQGRAPSRGGAIETSNSGSLQQLHNLPREGDDSPTSFSGTVQDGTLSPLGPMLNPEEPGAPIMVDVDTGDLDDDIESATIGVHRRNRVTQPGAYAVSVPAVSAPPSEPARRRMFRRNRDRHRDREIDFMEQIENAIGDDMPLDVAAEAHVTDSSFGGGGWRSRARRFSQRRSERRSSAGPHDGDDGGVVTVVQATAVDDEVFEASIVEDKDGLEQPRWSTSRKVGTALTAVAMIALVVGLAVSLKPAPKSDLPDDIADILAVGEGKACVNPDGQCACYSGHGYTGTQNVTTSGYTCQSWDQQLPHQHGYELSDRYSGVIENYCRANDPGDASPWCYTTNPEVRWECCNAPQCETFTVPVQLSAVEKLPPRRPICSTSIFDGNRQAPEDAAGIYLDGITNQISLPGSKNTTSGLNFDGPFTIEVWIKPEEKNDFSTILSNKEGGAGRSGFLFSVNTWEQNNGRLYLEGLYSRVASSVSVVWDKWQHIAVTYDGENVSFLIDGVQVPHYPVDEFYGPMNIKPSYLDARIGEIPLYFDGAITAQYNSHFKGVMDELKIWDHARTAEQLRTSMDCQCDGTEEGLVAYYRFDRSNGKDDRLVVCDSSLSGNHGILVDDTERAEEDAEVESAEGYRYTEGMSFCAEALCSAAA